MIFELSHGHKPGLQFLAQKPMTDDELAEALSSDFTCSTASAQEEKTSLTEVVTLSLPLHAFMVREN